MGLHGAVRWAVLGSLMLGLTACGSPARAGGYGPTPRPTRTPLPDVTPIFIPAGTVLPPTPAPPDVTLQPGWETLAPGLELRTAWMWVGGVSQPVEITIIRIDPDYFDLKVHEALDDSATVAEWQQRTGATVLINGAFFEPGETVLGLLVENGERHGVPFEGHGGMMTVSGGMVNVRALDEEPLLPGEAFDFAIQGRPMLLNPGGFAADFNLSPEASRRTAIAQDRDGNVLFIVNDYGAVSLYKLRDWLITSPELNISAAFNLDGGGSTGLVVQTGARSIVIDSWWEVATAVAVYPKSAQQ